MRNYARMQGHNVQIQTFTKKIVGSLIYLTATRPNVMFATSLLSKFMHNPTRIHMGTTKRVLIMVSSMKKEKLLFLWDYMTMIGVEMRMT